MDIRALSQSEKLDWLRLARSENIGVVTFFNLLQLYGTARKALEAAPTLSARGGRSKPLVLCSEASAKKEYEQTEKFGAKIIAACEPEYPALLREIKSFPPLITVLGNTDTLNKNSVAIVGARNASANGCRFATQMAHELGEKDLVVTSGLARGIDTAAHNGSLSTGTIAVVAGGIDKIYPPENMNLFREIAAQGAIIAEMPFGAIPKSQHFPRRNRIISGVSLGTLVVEASLASGSLITARMALEQNRDVFAVPGSPLDPRCKGTNSLIKQGAHLAESAEDIVNVLQQQSVNHSQHGLFDREHDGFKEARPQYASESDIDRARPEILEKLGATPVEVDEIITQTGLAPSIVLTVLLELELAGKLERQNGNKVALVYEELLESRV